MNHHKMKRVRLDVLKEFAVNKRCLKNSKGGTLIRLLWKITVMRHFLLQ